MTGEKEKFVKDFKRRLYSFALKLIEFIDNLKVDMVSKRISDQLLRSGTSILSNYVEGQSASSKKEFANFLTISLKSANESKMWIALLRDSKRTTKDKTDWFLNELDEFSKILASSILRCKGKR
ncbi:MAG TPA: four helix bundle protein [Anaerohalosphaeraceae bacterium]|nr:four helix bundle protein [Anaerohalosphaeraceae bacterium]